MLKRNWHSGDCLGRFSDVEDISSVGQNITLHLGLKNATLAVGPSYEENR